MDSYSYRGDVSAQDHSPAQQQLPHHLQQHAAGHHHHHHHHHHQQPQQQQHQHSHQQPPQSIPSQQPPQQQPQQQQSQQQQQQQQQPPSQPTAASISQPYPPPPPSRTFTGELERKSTHESKPRLSKEQHDILESHFKIQPKPSTQVKKGFAENLGVPLDKINNWFQNRRAKVKQENKKRQQAYNLYFTPAAAAAVGLDQSPDSAWIDHSFYQTVDAVPRHSMLVPPSLPVVAEVGDPVMVAPPPPGQPFSSAADASGMTLVAGGPEPYNEAVFQNFFGFPEAMSVDPQVDLTNGLSAFRKQFNGQGETFEPLLPPGVDFEPYHSSGPSSMLTRSSNDDSSLQLSSISGESYWDAFSSTAPSSRPSIADSRSEMESSHYTYGAALQQTRSHSSVMSRRPPVQQTVPENAPNFDDIHPETTRSKSEKFSGDDQSFPAQPEHFFRNAHAALHNARKETSTGSDDLDEELERPSTAIHQPSEASALISRRRQRPANLIPLRTSSYNATSTSSPSPSTTNPVVAEHSIRRIKSSNGVLRGRIQKTIPPPLPRSPHYLSFQEANGGQARFGRSISTSQLVQTPKKESPHDPTVQTGATSPHSPSVQNFSAMDLGANSFTHPSDVMEEMMWSQMTELDGLDTSNPGMSESGEDAQTHGSPPSTPKLGLQQPLNMNDQQPLDASHAIASWQQGIDAEQHVSQQQPFHNDDAGAPLTHSASFSGPSTVTIDPSNTLRTASVPGGSGDDHVQRLRHSVSHQQFGWGAVPQNAHFDFAMASQIPKGSAGYCFQEWSPRDVSDPNLMRSRAQVNQLPRSYQFSNHTPATFTSP